jgi:hypothetical protein
MTNRPQVRGNHYFAPVPGIRPGEYPLGSLRSRAAARGLASAYAHLENREVEDELKNLTATEHVLIEDTDDPIVRLLMVRLLRTAQERQQIYGLVLQCPTIDEIRHNRAVMKEANRISFAEAEFVKSSDSQK